MPKFLPITAGLAILALSACAQTQKTTGTPDRPLTELEKKDIARRQEVDRYAEKHNIPKTKKDKNGNTLYLHHIDETGQPVYWKSYNNLRLAQNVRARQLWQGGSLGLNLQGQNMEVSATQARLGMWEPASTRTTHTEFGGRAVQRDAPAFSTPSSDADHAAHVAGTMIGGGMRDSARGMAWQAHLDCYEIQSLEKAEMATAAIAGMLVSNHSYGPDYDSSLRAQGKYDAESREYDSILHANPYYQPLFAAGNERDDANGVTYDVVSGGGLAKNTLCIGATLLIDSPGYSNPASVVVSDFSNFGPADDSRIKPDFTAPGSDIFSASSQADNGYTTLSGTSMATPGSAGALFLLQQHYKNTRNGAFMRAATLKGLAIHTCEEAGTAPGPDAKFGWGFLNVEKAIRQLNDSTTTHYMEQAQLSQGNTYAKDFRTSGGALRATICWNDVPGEATPDSAVNDRSAKLVNDLDLRIVDKATGAVVATLPWKLNALSPGDHATRGDNSRDNVEQIDIDNLPAGEYTLRVNHKGTLQGGPQDFSVFLSGGAVSMSILNTPEFAKNAVLFPNPTTGNVKIRFTETQSRVSVRILNTMGQAVYTAQAENTNAISLHIEGAPGLYIVEVRNADQALASYMVNKQ